MVFSVMTPMMLQWKKCKDEAKEALLLFRLGDFYEAFFEDAQTLSDVLEIVLTKRSDVPMSGIPAQSLESAVDRLVSKGFKIAIAEQVGEVCKGLVERKIVRVVTRGTLIDSSLLEEKMHNYIATIYRFGASYGLALVELSLGECRVTELESFSALLAEVKSVAPSEIIVEKKMYDALAHEYSTLYTLCDDVDHKSSYATLCAQFNLLNLDCLGLKGKPSATHALGLLFHTLKENHLPLSHVKKPLLYSNECILEIDATSVRNLELHSLLRHLDKTSTAMGGRLLRLWLKKPLRECAEIAQRQKAIQELFFSGKTILLLTSHLKGVRDLERLIMKISSNLATPKDFYALKLSLDELPAIQKEAKPIPSLKTDWIDQTPLASYLQKALVDDPPLKMGDAPLFRPGFDQELDRYMELKNRDEDFLAKYQQELRTTLGIKTLKVGYHKVFGYTIEVSRGASEKMPPHFHRKQTLATQERFTSPELKEYEESILSLEEKIRERERSLFSAMQDRVLREASAILEIAGKLAQLDALVSLAIVARENHYVPPTIVERGPLLIEGGRHPVVEALLPANTFIPNDTLMEDASPLQLITGPNMGGKSTFIRQVALIVILAHMGSFVPAKRASIPLMDKIFTRIGAQDDLSRGQSTFMVEMSETAHILQCATPSSLVILDEVGRGTSTFDGVAIAWAIAEYLLEKGCKTLFATHYFELTALEKKGVGALNYHATVEERGDAILFLHKIERGQAPRSYGITVAKLAGLPLSVITKAHAILARLEKNKMRKEVDKEVEEQLLLF